MKLLLDTHVIVWFLSAPSRLDPRVIEALQSEQASILVSVASWWELGIKHALGRLGGAMTPQQLRDSFLEHDTVRELSICAEHAFEATSLPHHHRDPFDRMLIAQARIEGAMLVSGDGFIKSYDVQLMWAER